MGLSRNGLAASGQVRSSSAYQTAGKQTFRKVTEGAGADRTNRRLPSPSKSAIGAAEQVAERLPPEQRTPAPALVLQPALDRRRDAEAQRVTSTDQIERGCSWAAEPGELCAQGLRSDGMTNGRHGE
jgi:hypothetical protein